MRKILLSFILCLLCMGLVAAQEEQTPYEIALERIREAEASGATELDLSYLGLTELPPEIGNLSNLQRLDLNENQINSLPSEIGNLSNLQHLHLSYNQFNSLPSEIGKLSNLQGLSAASNQLSSLPSEIGNLSNLQRLDLFDNEFTTLPSEIGELSSLQMLLLGSNHLSSLPPEIGNLSSLCYLELRDNDFQNIPIELYHLEGLVTLDNCSRGNGLMIDTYLLETIPEEVANGSTPAILAYLENEAWWHLQRLIAGGAGSIGLLSAVVLGWRWRNRRGYEKKKNYS